MVDITGLPYGWGGPQKQLAADPIAEVMRYLFETGFIDENGQLTPAAQNQVAASAFGGVPSLTLQGLMGNRTPGLKPGYNPLNSMSHDSVYGDIVSGPQSSVGKGNPVRDQTIPGPPTRDTFESQIAQQLANLARGFDVEQKKRADPGGWSLPDYNPDTDNLLGDIADQLGKYLENYRLPGLTIGGVNGQPGSGPIFRNPFPTSEDVKGILEAAKNILPVFDEKGNIVKEPTGSPKTTGEGKTDQPPIAGGGTDGEEKPTVKDDDNNILPTLGGILAGFPQGDKDMAVSTDDLKDDSNWFTDFLGGFFGKDFGGGNAASSIGDILRGGVSSAVNFYGNEKAADALERASDKQLEFNQSVLDTLRSDLDPFKQMGINAIPGLIDAAGTTPSSAAMDSRFGGLRSGQIDQRGGYFGGNYPRNQSGGISQGATSSTTNQSGAQSGGSFLDQMEAAQREYDDIAANTQRHYSGGGQTSLPESGGLSILQNAANKGQAVGGEQELLQSILSNNSRPVGGGGQQAGSGSLSTMMGGQGGAAEFAQNYNNRQRRANIGGGTPAAGQYDLQLDTGISNQDLMDSMFGGFNNLQDVNVDTLEGLQNVVMGGRSGFNGDQLVGKAGEGYDFGAGATLDTSNIPGLIERGSDEWNAIIDDNSRTVSNLLAGKGKLGSGELVEGLTRDAMLRGAGQIEAINQSRQGRELSKRYGDFDRLLGQQYGDFDRRMAKDAQEYSQYADAVKSGFGMDESANARMFAESLGMRRQQGDERARQFAEQLALRGQQVDEQLAGSDRRFGQMSSARDQIFRELLGEQQSEFDNLFNLNNQDFSQRQAERSQVWSELMGEDAQGFEKLLNLVTQGQSSAARQAASAIGLSPQFSDAFGADATASAMRSKGVTDLMDSLFGGGGKDDFYKQLIEMVREGR